MLLTNVVVAGGLLVSLCTAHVQDVLYLCPSALPMCRYTEEEIEQQVSVLRVALSSEARPVDAFAKETHMLAEATELKKQQLKSAFGIREDYVEGSAFDSEQQALRAAQARAEREEKAR